MRPGTRATIGASVLALLGVGVVPGATAVTTSPAIVHMVTLSSGAPSTPAPRRLLTGWLPYWNMGTAIGAVTANSSVLTDVSPFWYDARGYAPNVGIVDQSYGLSGGPAGVVKQFHSYGLKVLPTVTDGTAGWKQMAAQLSTVSGRARMVSLLVNQVTGIGADGVDLDWEQFAFSDGSASWSSTRPNWIAFVRSLAYAMHARGKLLSITVPAGNATSSDSTGYSVYAWAEIGPVIDRLRIMTYDYSPSTPGPIGPYPWIDAVAAYAVTQVAASKVQIGLASYGRDWVWSSAGSCPALAPAGATSTQAGSFFANMQWAWHTHEYDSSYAANYVATLFKSAAATTPGIALVQAPVNTWDSTYKERTFSYAVKFTGRDQAATVGATVVSGIAGGTSLMVASTTGLRTGDAIAGWGIAAGAKIASLTPTLIGLTKSNTASVRGPLTVTETNVVTAAGSALTASTTLHVPLNTPTHVGDGVTGTGIPASTSVTKVVAGTVDIALTLSKATTAAVSTNVTLTSTRILRPVAVGGRAGLSQLLFPSSAGIRIGASVTGTGIGAGAKVTALSAVVVTLSVPNAGSVTGSVAFKPAAVTASCTISRQGWYSEAQSAIARATLVDKYHLGGMAEWTIGGEDPGQWPGLKTYAAAIAAWPSVIAATGPSLLAAHTATSLSGSVTYRGSAAANVPVILQVRPLGSAVFNTVAVTNTDLFGRFTTTLPAQIANFTWRATALGDGWRRLAASVAEATTVPVPAVILASGPRTLLPASAGAVNSTVLFNGAPLANAYVRVAVGPTAAGPWTQVGAAATTATGAVTVPIPGQLKDFHWQVFVAGDGYGRLDVGATGVVGIAVPAVVRASAAAFVSAGASNTLRGSVTFKGLPIQTALMVQVEPAGTATWLTLPSINSAANGTFSSLLPARLGNYTWRAVVPADGYTRLAGSVMGSVGVRFTVTAVPAATKIKSGARPVFHGVVGPAVIGTKAYLQRWTGSAWATQGVVGPDITGRYTLTGGPIPPVGARYRVVAVPVNAALHATGYSVIVAIAVG